METLLVMICVVLLALAVFFLSMWLRGLARSRGVTAETAAEADRVGRESAHSLAVVQHQHEVAVTELRGQAEVVIAGLRAEATRFGGIKDLEAHQRSLHADTASLEARISGLSESVAEREGRLAEVQGDVASVEEVADAQSFGFYEPQYGLESAEAYAEQLADVRGQQKALVKEDPFSGAHEPAPRPRAALAPNDWTVDGSAAKGRKMVKEHIKLMLRAFNGECDAAVAKVKYNNVLKLAERIGRSHEAINRLGQSKGITISIDYRDLKLAELHLVHEHREQKQAEREEQQRIKAQMREDQKAQKEFEKVELSAAKEEARQVAALDKARAEMVATTGAQTAKLAELVKKLETELSVAIDRKAKAIARAQLTRSGHVYVLSNVGSFGEGVYKLGMTRRLEPLDRVKELGDASVPFRFDVHAMIYSEDAPALERALHKHFNHRRVNRVNLRREYFRITLDEVRQAVAKLHGIVTFVLEPEAEEYRKTLAIEAEPVAAAG